MQRRRTRAVVIGVFVFSLARGMVSPVAAQLEVLLRGVEPSLPRSGVCGLYRFESREPDGDKSSEFVACVEPVSDAGPVILMLEAGDSLQVRIEVARQLFTEPGAQLAEHILSVERQQDGVVERLTPEDWQKHPALAPAAPLPVRADSSLGTRTITFATGTDIEVQGHHRWESRHAERALGGVQVSTNEDRWLETWTAPAGPILGVVLAEATVRSERIFSEPIPGVPVRGPRTMHYRLELLKILQSE